MTSPERRANRTGGPTPPAPEAVAVDRRFDADGLYTLRAEVAAHASHLGANRAQVQNLLIVASELATNAVRHGGGSGHLRLWLAERTLVCQVSDRGSGLANPTVGSTPPDTMAHGGRGLWICRQLSTQVEIETSSMGTTVTASLDLDSSPTT